MGTPSIKDLIGKGAEMLTPSKYYRAVHPDLFSDSEESKVNRLPRDLFMFQLNELTAQKKEYEFEDFCRLLSEREICPNLLPQTGPLGGGDSKTDGSTYPVADELRQRRLWVGHTKPSNENWAFAFSCKKDWRPKAKSDVRKIAELPTKFLRAIFITNQPVKDKARAELEAALSKELDIIVSIFDRNWIVEKVDANGHQELAIDSLGLELGPPTISPRVGPRDATRSEQYSELREKLQNPDLLTAGDYVLAKDFLRAAKLASSLERTRAEVDGLFLQARDLATRSGHLGAFFDTHYQHAWRSYFWYDDAQKTESILTELLRRLDEVTEAKHCELICNLVSILDTASMTGFYRQDATEVQGRHRLLGEKLETIAANKAQKNNSLYAETLLLNLRHRPKKDTDLDSMRDYFNRIADIFKRSTGLGTYPLIHFMEVFEEMGQVFCDRDGYDYLHSTIQEIKRDRFGDFAAGESQLDYGNQLLNKGKCEMALSNLSEARFLLAKSETLDGSACAGLGCAAAYASLGSRWAARMETLAAAHIALNSIEQLDESPERALYVTKRMAWLELELGRVPQFLAWRNMVNLMLKQIQARGGSEENYLEELTRQDGCMGCVFLKAGREGARRLIRLAPALEQMGLEMARMGLLLACGETEALAKVLIEHGFEAETCVDDVRRGFEDQPAFEQISAMDIAGKNGIHEIAISKFEVDFVIRHSSRFSPSLIAECVAGALDAVLATAKWENFAFVFDRVCIYFDESEDGEMLPSFQELRYNPEAELPLVWKTGFKEWLSANRDKFGDYVCDLIIHIFAAITIDPLDELKGEFESWAKQGVFSRAYVAGQSSIALLDIIPEHYYGVENWYEI